jgi:hypothetical protein
MWILIQVKLLFFALYFNLEIFTKTSMCIVFEKLQDQQQIIICLQQFTNEKMFLHCL